MPLPNHVQEKRDEIVEQVIQDIQAGKPFFWDCEHYGKPAHNIAQGNLYHGLNRMRLIIASKENQFTDSRWGTYQQAQARGWQVRKGEKGSHIEWWSFSKTEKGIDPATGEETRKDVRLDRPMVKSYVVFNASQMDNVPPEHPITIDESQKNAYMENLLKNSEAKIFFDESYRNYYQPIQDEIHVLPREKFRTLDAFYATCVHEIAHSTGHKSRLDRNLMTGGDQEEYAKEELRAELTSMFIAQDWGLAFDEKHYQSHEAYLQSWAKVLKDDPNELYRAASKAQEMADYIEKNMLLKGMELPPDLVKDELKRTAPQKEEMQTEGVKEKSSARQKAGRTNPSKEQKAKDMAMAM